LTAPAAFPTVGSAGSLPLTHSARSPIGKINLQKVIVGGLVAGVVLNVVDYLLFGVVLKKDLPVMSTNTILWFVLMDFLYGIFLVWFYAAIRPRFGPGPRTAVYAGLAIWVLYGLLHALMEAPFHMFPTNVTVITTVVALFEWPIAVVAGAKLYTEM